MKLACTSFKTPARWAAQLALSTLVVMTGCPADDDTDTDGTTDATAATATEATDATAATQPTTGGEETGTTTTGAAAVDYAMDIQPIWDTKCVVGCHTPGGVAATNGPLLDADVSHANLVDKQSPTVALPLVAPGDPDGSYLWHKINGTMSDVGGVGAKMPIGPGLDDATLALVEQWIADGAQP